MIEDTAAVELRPTTAAASTSMRNSAVYSALGVTESPYVDLDGSFEAAKKSASGGGGLQRAESTSKLHNAAIKSPKKSSQYEG